ncbi:MAG: hypothetical protein F4Y04_00615 [Chloroflexi bacterium]|nr:hypothetical protein [Chloroflexota bacterium]
MRRPGLLLLVAALTGFVCAGLIGVAAIDAQAAEDGPTVQGTRFENSWPDSVVVTALVGDAGEIESATFLYAILPEGALTREAAEINQGDVTRIRAEFPTRNPRLWIPAGADFEWRWEFVYASGETFETEPQIWRYEDPRFEWQSLTEGDLEVAWYHDRGVAETMLREGLQALEEISPFLGLEELIPIKVYVWANTEDARQVERIQSERFEESVITGGTRVLADLVHIYQPTRWVVRHELTHVLTKLAGEGPYGDLPAWLDEGMATLAEGDWLERRGGALQYAINNDLVLSLRSMESPSNVPGSVDIFYGQSAAVVLYLLGEYGNEKMNELFATFKEGSSVEDALDQVYGLTRDGLDNDWRASVGLAPREQGEDRSTTIEDEVIAGPEVAEDEQSSGEQTERQAEQSTGESDQAQQPARQAEQASQDESSETDGQSTATRTEGEIAERKAEIQQRQDQRRSGPVFEAPAPFPWEYPLIGIAGGLVLLSGLLLVRVLTPRRD